MAALVWQALVTEDLRKSNTEMLWIIETPCSPA